MMESPLSPTGSLPSDNSIPVSPHLSAYLRSALSQIANYAHCHKPLTEDGQSISRYLDPPHDAISYFGHSILPQMS